MTNASYIIFIVPSVAFSILWLISEIKSYKKSSRIVLGSITILSSILFCYGMAELNNFNYNLHYSTAAKDLTEAISNNLNSSNVEIVKEELEKFNKIFQPTYEPPGVWFIEQSKLLIERLNKNQVNKTLE